MHFLVPWMLAGAAGVSVPIAIHLLNRYRFKEIEWGAMELLRKVVIVRSRRIRLEDLLLLLVRCAIVLLIVLVMSRPVVSPSAAAWLGQGSEASVVIALDGSFSMGHRSGANSRFDVALEKVREIGRTLKPGSSVTLVLMGDRPRFLMRNETFDPARFDARLKDAAPLPERLNLEACLGELASKSFTDELKAAALEVYVVTDGQTATWEAPTEVVRKSVDRLAELGRVSIVPLDLTDAENLALTKFDLKTGLFRKGVTVQVQATNFGKRVRDVPIDLLVNDVSVDQNKIEKLEAGKSAAVTMFARIDKAGAAKLTARIDGDELLVDNSRHAVATIHEKLRVLLVRQQSNDPNDPDYVSTSLTPSASDVIAVDSINWLDLGSKKLADYQVVVLSDVPDLPDEQIRNLYYFVQDGGGLIVFPGDFTQPIVLNSRFQFDKTPLLPAEIGDVVSDPDGISVQPLDHPLSRVLAKLPEQVTSEARVRRYFKLTPEGTARTALKLIGRNDPVVVEKSLGRGRVVLFAAAANRNWTNMVVEPAFYPLLIQEAVSYVSRPAHDRQFTVSESISAPLAVSLKDGQEIKKVTFRPQVGTPTSRAPEKLKDGQVVAQLPAAEQPGFYEITTEPTTTAISVAVNVDTSESRVDVFPADVLAQRLRDWPVRVMSASDNITASVQESRIGRELWKELLVLAFALLAFEGLLARWMTHKKTASPEFRMG